MSDDFTIESMPLYTNLDRITKGLAALGLGPTDPIRPEQLFPFDQWHYHGTDAIRTAAEQLGIASESQVLDIGVTTRSVQNRTLSRKPSKFSDFYKHSFVKWILVKRKILRLFLSKPSFRTVP